jgi:hypothetical protein
MAKKMTYLAKSDAEYKRLNLKKATPEVWEDGMRTNGGKGSYEWWYFDAHLDDGSKMVIVFYTKPMTAVNKGLSAYATLNIDYKDGASLERYLPSTTFKAANEQCNVQIGDCSFKGDLHTYRIHMQGADFSLDLEFKNTSQSWRPETGHYSFGNNGDFFAWLVAVPKGEVKVKYTIAGKEVSTQGGCYHDHNWGNKGIHKLINHWYWSRSELGPYSVIACQIVPEKKYGNKPVMIACIAKDGEIIADNADKLQLIKSDPITGLGGKPIYNELLFSYTDKGQKFELKLNRNRNIMETYLIQQQFQRKLAKLLLGFNRAYFRITGKAKLSVDINNQTTETYQTDNAIWELMYFGKP